MQQMNDSKHIQSITVRRTPIPQWAICAIGAYRPDGEATGSLGAFEHWDNPFDRRYSSNRGLPYGIELVTVE